MLSLLKKTIFVAMLALVFVAGAQISNAQTVRTGGAGSCDPSTNPTCTCTSQQWGGFGADRPPVMRCEWTESDGSTNTGTTNVISGSGSVSSTNADGSFRSAQTFSSGQAESCGPLQVGCWIKKLPGMLIVVIAFLFLYLAGLILFLAGTLFNWVVLRTVFQFGEYFGTSEGMLVAWGVMRDIANIGLLFAFVLIGIMLILNVERFGGSASAAKKAIPRLIIFAVLLNFSLFTTQLVIDVANAFGSSFTTLAQENCSTQATSESGGGQSLQDCAVNNGISGRIMQIAGLTGVWWSDSGTGFNDAVSNFSSRPYSYAVSLIMLSVFVLVAALVLLAGAIMLIIRVVVLSFLMVTSPVGFAGMVVPGLGGIAKQWWHTLLNQAFFAPVYLLLIFVSLKMAENLMGNDPNATLANAVIADAGNAVAGNVQVVMVYLIVIGFMVGSLILANKMGAMGAKFAISSAASLTVGSAGFVGRRTLGAASRAGANAVASSQWARNNGIGSRMAYNALNKGATSSWSLRTGMNSALGVAGVSGQVGLGSVNKRVAGGMRGIEKAVTEDRVNFSKNLQQTGAESTKEKEYKKEKETLEEKKKTMQTKRESEQVEEKREEESIKNERGEVTILRQEFTSRAQSRESEIKTRKQQIDQLETDPNTSPEKEARLVREQQALAQLERAHQEQSEQETTTIQNRQDAIKTRVDAIKTRQDTFKKEVADVDKQIKDLDTKIDVGYTQVNEETGEKKFIPGVSEKAVQRTYGEKLEKGGLRFPGPLNKINPSIEDPANKAASKKILGALKKSKKDELFDSIKKATAEEDGAKGDKK